MFILAKNMGKLHMYILEPVDHVFIKPEFD